MSTEAAVGGTGTASCASVPGPSMPQMPLSFAKTGQRFAVLKVRGNEDMKRHLNELGFVEGAVVNVINAISGDLVISVKGSQLAVGRDITQRIIGTIV